MEKLAQKNRDKVVDVLAERLCFERADVKLYDKILETMRESKEPAVIAMTPQMEEYRDQEKEHRDWLEQCIRQLGGDDRQVTDRARIAALEAAGIEEVVTKDRELPYLFHALLAAELVDSAGWDLLVELADEAGDRKARKEFKKRHEEEAQHLSFVREAMKAFSAHEVLGEELRAPSSRNPGIELPLA